MNKLTDARPVGKPVPDALRAERRDDQAKFRPFDRIPRHVGHWDGTDDRGNPERIEGIDELIRRGKLKPGDVHVLKLMLRFVPHPELGLRVDSVWVTKEWLADKIDRTPRTIQNAWRRLEACNLVRQQRVPIPDPDDPRNRTSARHYFPWLLAEGAAQPTGADRRDRRRNPYVRKRHANQGGEKNFSPPRDDRRAPGESQRRLFFSPPAETVFSPHPETGFSPKREDLEHRHEIGTQTLTLNVDVSTSPKTSETEKPPRGAIRFRDALSASFQRFWRWVTSPHAKHQATGPRPATAAAEAPELGQVVACEQPPAEASAEPQTANQLDAAARPNQEGSTGPGIEPAPAPEAIEATSPATIAAAEVPQLGRGGQFERTSALVFQRLSQGEATNRRPTKTTDLLAVLSNPQSSVGRADIERAARALARDFRDGHSLKLYRLVCWQLLRGEVSLGRVIDAWEQTVDPDRQVRCRGAYFTKLIKGDGNQVPKPAATEAIDGEVSDRPPEQPPAPSAEPPAAATSQPQARASSRVPCPDPQTGDDPTDSAEETREVLEQWRRRAERERRRLAQQGAEQETRCNDQCPNELPGASEGGVK